MNKLSYIIICLLGVSLSLNAQEDFRKEAPKGGPAPKIELGESTTFKLDNGLTVIVVENDRLPRVNFQLLVDAPPIVEGEKAGAASIAGQLLRSGTTSRTKAEIDEAIDFIGASLGASAGGIFGSSLTKHTDALLEIMQEILLMPSFPEEEFTKIKDQLKSSLAASQEDPNVIAGRVGDILRYGADHPYGEFETEKTIDNITLADIRAYYDTYFKPNISYLAIVGDISVAKARQVANEYFGDWERGEVTKNAFTNPQLPEKTKVVLVNKPGAVQSVINVTHPIYIKTGSENAMAASLMNAILGTGSRGRLFRNLREDKGYTYGAYSRLSTDQEVGYFSASASVRNEVTDSSITEILHELNRIRTEVVDAQILQETKNRISGAFARGTESPQTIANYALNIIRYDLPEDFYASYLERLEAVSAEEIQAAAQKYVRPEGAYIFVVGNQDEIMEQLERFGKVELLDIYGQSVKAAVSAGDMTPVGVINKYLDAIGGKSAVAAVEDVTIEMQASIQGQTMTTKMVKKAPAKMKMEVSMMGSVVQAVTFDGTAGSMNMMGQSQKIEGEAAAGMKTQAAIFPELMYDENTPMELKGIEELNGEDVYVVQLKTATGGTEVSYFSVDTGLKLRTVSTEQAQGQTMTTTVDFMDYKEESGIKFPMVQKTSGGPMPFPIEMKVQAVQVNSGVADDLFSIE
jgi:predicted Zn-dependent peptidase